MEHFVRAIPQSVQWIVHTPVVNQIFTLVKSCLGFCGDSGLKGGATGTLDDNYHSDPVSVEGAGSKAGSNTPGIPGSGGGPGGARIGPRYVIRNMPPAIFTLDDWVHMQGADLEENWDHVKSATCGANPLWCDATGRDYANAALLGASTLAPELRVLRVVPRLRPFRWLWPRGSGGAGPRLPGPTAAEGIATRATAEQLASANRIFRNGPLTNVGRALTKHPNVIGESGNVLKSLGGAKDVNGAAAQALENIMQDGAMTTKMTRAFGQVIDYTLPSGIGARFSAETNEFIGFLGRGL
jgi:hypothetical protein